MSKQQESSNCEKTLIYGALFSMLNPAALANATDDTPTPTLLDKVMMIGNPDNVEQMRGTADVVTKEEIH